MPFFDVRHRSLLIATRGKEIFEVPPRGRCGEQLSLFMLLVLRIFFTFVDEVAMDSVCR